MIPEKEIDNFLRRLLLLEKDSLEKNPNRGHSEKMEVKRQADKALNIQIENMIKG